MDHRNKKPLESSDVNRDRTVPAHMSTDLQILLSAQFCINMLLHFNVSFTSVVLLPHRSNLTFLDPRKTPDAIPKIKLIIHIPQRLE